MLTSDNSKQVLSSSTIKIVFVSPEVLEQTCVVQALLAVKESIILKLVDEAHLFAAWGVQKKKGRSFRPAMRLSSGELSCLGGITVLQTATASSKTI